MPTIKTIIFDLGGVLINWDPKLLYRKIFDTEEKVDWFLENVCTFEWNEAQDGGRSISEANEIAITKYPEYQNEIEAFYGRWTEMLNGAKEDVVAILKTLINDPDYKVIALTNWSAETWPWALERFEFLHWFEDVLVSGQEKLKKPDPKIYQMILKRNSLIAEECIFIDDNLRNIEAARNEGILGIHFKNGSQLMQSLKDHNIKID